VKTPATPPPLIQNGTLEERYRITVEDEPPRGGLFELEQTTVFRVVDVRTNEVILAYQGMMEASLDPATGDWGEYRLSGVSGVTIAPDERTITVKHHDGRAELVPLR